MKAIIAAGGKGTRLRPLTFTSNKHLLPIANKPLLLYAFENIVKLGIKEIGIIVNESKPAVEALLGKGTKWGVKITYINQVEPLGLAHVIKISQNFLGKSPFVYQLGDNIFTSGVEKPYKKFLNLKPDALLTIIKHEENYRLGVPYFQKGKLIKVVEKPKNPPNKYGIPGLYFFNHKVFDAFSGTDAIKPSARGELEITDLFNYLLEQGCRVEVAEIKGEWLDPGKFDDSLRANRILLNLNCQREIRGKTDATSKIVGEVSIGKNSKIIGSYIIGPCSIAEGVCIEGSSVGPYVSVSSGCEIVNSSIEDTILMEGVRVLNCPIKIEASMIGKNSNISGSLGATPTYKLTISDMSVIEVPK